MWNSCSVTLRDESVRNVIHNYHCDWFARLNSQLKPALLRLKDVLGHSLRVWEYQRRRHRWAGFTDSPVLRFCDFLLELCGMEAASRKPTLSTADSSKQTGADNWVFAGYAIGHGSSSTISQCKGTSHDASRGTASGLVYSLFARPHSRKNLTNRQVCRQVVHLLKACLW